MFCAVRYGLLGLFVPLASIGQIANACTAPERPFLPERSEDIREYADLLRPDFESYIAAYNFARVLKTHNSLTPYEYICNLRTSEPDRFIINPIHQIPGLDM